MIGLVFRMAWRNLLRHPRRTILVGLSVAAGASAIVFNAGFISGVTRQLVDSLVISQVGHVRIVPMQELAGGEADHGFGLLSDPAGIESAVRERLERGEVSYMLTSLGMILGETASSSRVALWGIQPERDRAWMARLQERCGSSLPELAPGSVFVGARLGERLRLHEGSQVTLAVPDLAGELNADDFTVSAVLEPGAPWEDYYIHLVLGDLQDLMLANGSVNVVKVTLPPGAGHVDPLVDELGDALKGSGQAVRVESYREGGAFFFGIIRAIRVQLGVMDLILMVAIALVVASAQILAVKERQREIGTMAALGTGSSTIRAVFLAEGGLLALIFGLVGVLLGTVVTLILSRTGIGMTAQAFSWVVAGSRVYPHPDLLRSVLSVLALVVVVMLAGYYPASRAARLSPIRAVEGNPL